jgi:hypothetical protein
MRSEMRPELGFSTFGEYTDALDIAARSVTRGVCGENGVDEIYGIALKTAHGRAVGIGGEVGV